MDIIKYILTTTLHESIISIIKFIDLIMPDWTIFSRIRAMIWSSIINVGKATRFRKGTHITRLSNLNIGKKCFINRGNIFDNVARVEIGDNCSIGYNNHFLTNSHYEKGNQMESKTTFAKEITIGRNVWITTNCVILPGTIIHDNVIIAAGAVVRGELKSNYIYGGIPAVKIRVTSGKAVIST